MSRRWIPRRTEPDTAEQPDASAADLDQLRVDNAALREKLDATEAQLRWHKTELADTEAAARIVRLRADELELTVDVQAADLDRERKHVAGSCSHAAELRGLKGTLTALEKRVAELQRANEGYEAPGWTPRTDSAALKRLGLAGAP